MVNLVEYLVDQQIIVKEQGWWKVDMGCLEIEQGVPTNVRHLIEKQIERLSADERMVLEAASVAGMECSSVAIAAGLDMPVEWVEKHCEELARRHQFLSPAWLVELPDRTVTPRHRFIHILYRDVPCRLMAPRRRSQIHQRIAERGMKIYGNRSNEIAAELAMHFEQSRDWPRAIEFLLQAAENAATRSAHHEATDLANRGLEVLKFLPEGDEHAKQEMKLRMTLGVSLMAIKGFASNEVEEVFVRGRELFWRQGPSPELFNMLWSLGLHYQFTGQVPSSLEISEQLLQMAEGLDNGPLIMEAHRSIGAALVILGRCTDALKHLNEASTLYATHCKHRQSIYIGRDCKVMSESFAARALWALGYPDEAAERMDGALALARELGHPQTLVVAGYFAAQLHQSRGEVSLVVERVKEAMELAEEYGLEFWLPYGAMELGWAEAELGNLEQGIQQMQRGMAAYERTGATLWFTYFAGLLADQLAKAGRVEEGLAMTDRALTYAEHSGEKYSLAELYRLKGELLVKRVELAADGKQVDIAVSKVSELSSTLVQAEACFADALAVAKQQQTRAWELKAHLSMDHLALRQGQPN